MLLPLAVSLVFAVGGAFVVLKVAQATVDRLELDIEMVLVWLGLADLPLDELSARRLGDGYRRGERLVRPRRLEW